MDTPIKPTLLAMKIGDKTEFPKSRRKSVRTTATDIKTDVGMKFTTEVKEDKIYVKRCE